MKTEYTIDGKDFSSLEEFFREISRVLIPDADWGHNLDAFNDILRGGFGTPDEGFVLRWKNSGISAERLGFPSTVKYLESKLETCHPSNRDYVRAALENAKANQGETLFQILVAIIKTHTAAGEESEDGVELALE